MNDQSSRHPQESEQSNVAGSWEKLWRGAEVHAVLYTFLVGAAVAVLVGTGAGAWWGFTWKKCENSISEGQAFVIAAAGFAIWIVVVEQMLSSRWFKELALKGDGIRFRIVLALGIAVAVLVGVGAGAAFPADRIPVSISSGLGAGLLIFFLCWPWGPKRSSPNSGNEKPAEAQPEVTESEASSDPAKTSHESECGCQEEIGELKTLIEQRLPPPSSPWYSKLVKPIKAHFQSATGREPPQLPNETGTTEQSGGSEEQDQ